MVARFRNELLAGRFGLAIVLSLSLVMFGGCPGVAPVDDGTTADNTSGTDGTTGDTGNTGTTPNDDQTNRPGVDGDAELFTLTHFGSVVVDTDEYTAKSVITGTAEVALTPNEATTVAVPYNISVDIDGKTDANGDRYTYTPNSLALEGTLRWTVTYVVDGTRSCVEVVATVFNADSQLVEAVKITGTGTNVDLGATTFEAFAAQLGGTVVPPNTLTDEACQAPFTWQDSWEFDGTGVYTDAQATVVITPVD